MAIIAKDEAPKVERELIINDFVIEQMEKAWYRLPEQVKMNREQISKDNLNRRQPRF